MFDLYYCSFRMVCVFIILVIFCFFFFIQAENGSQYGSGVQTSALPLNINAVLLLQAADRIPAYITL